MPAFTPNGLTDVANQALVEVGVSPIDDINSQNGNAPFIVRAAFWPAVREVAREQNWNCLKKRQNLVQLALPGTSSCDCTSIGWPGCYPSPNPPPYWTANTPYSGGDLVTWGEAQYYALYDQASGTNFIIDMTNGLWAQVYIPACGQGCGGAGGGLYEWRFGYALPADFVLAVELNGQNCRNGAGVGDLYELFVTQVVNGDQTVSSSGSLFCNESYADLKYTALIQDPTIWDPLFTNAVAINLASKIATAIRADDGVMAANLRKRYLLDTLPNAKLKDAGERKPYRYDPVAQSNFLKSRWNSTNG